MKWGVMKWLLKTGSALATSALCVTGALSGCQSRGATGGGGDSGEAPDSADAGPGDATVEAAPEDGSEPDASGSDARAEDASSGPLDAATPEDAEAGAANLDAATPEDAEAGASNLDAATPEDAEAGAATLDSSTDAAPVDDASSGGGLVCSSTDAGQPLTWCVDGAPCTPASQCHVGSLSCATLTCVDTGNAAADGTACSSGTCHAGACSEACSGPFNVSTTDCTPNPCVYGSCNAVSGGGLCQTPPSASLVPNGAVCGSNAHQVCESGACAVVSCISNAECGASERCDAPPAPCSVGFGNCAGYSFRCVSDPCMSSGVAALDGTTCGPDNRCSGGLCVTQLAVTATAPTLTPGVPFTGTLAHVSDSLGTDMASSLTATIDWGDGTVSAGTVSGASSPFVVGGFSHVRGARRRPPDRDRHGRVGRHLGFDETGGQRGRAVITEFTVPYGGAGIAGGPDGNLWFSEDTYQHANIGRVTTGGTFTEFVLPSGYIASGMASGPDGHLWFTAQNTNTNTFQVVRVTTAGDLTYFAIPSHNAYPAGITAGPDGNVWFTEETTQRHWTGDARGGGHGVPARRERDPTDGHHDGAGREPLVHPRGLERARPHDTRRPACGVPHSVLPLGLRELSAGRRGRCRRQSVVHGGHPVGHGDLRGEHVHERHGPRLPMPFKSARPSAIASGPDGNLWFVDSTNSTIDRVTTAGAFTIFVIPTANAQPVGIAAGPDGRMWFTESGAPGIGTVAVP